MMTSPEPHDERTLRLVRETVDDTTTYTPDDDGYTAEHLCPPMSVRERRSAPRPDGMLNRKLTDEEMREMAAAMQNQTLIHGPFDSEEEALSAAWGTPVVRIPRHREGINLGKFIAVLGVMVGGAALLVGVAVWYVAIGFRYLP